MSINKDKTYPVEIRWYCRICWSKGLKVAHLRMYDRVMPTNDELISIVRLTKIKCCKTPDMRIVYDKEKLEKFCCGYSN